MIALTLESNTVEHWLLARPHGYPRSIQYPEGKSIPLRTSEKKLRVPQTTQLRTAATFYRLQYLACLSLVTLNSDRLTAGSESLTSLGAQRAWQHTAAAQEGAGP